jgi:hypothetical protein
MGYGLGRKSVENKASVRTVLLASADLHFRARLRQELTAMRWQVRCWRRRARRRWFWTALCPTWR